MAVDCTDVISVRTAVCNNATDIQEMITLGDDGTLTTNYSAKPIALLVKEKLITGLQALGIDYVWAYVWADATARNAQAGMATGEQGYQTDTGIVYEYDGAVWQVVAVATGEQSYNTVTSEVFKYSGTAWILFYSLATSASITSTDTTNFNGILSGADTDVQKALETIDDFSVSSINSNAVNGMVSGTVVLNGSNFPEVNGTLLGTNGTISGSGYNIFSEALSNISYTTALPDSGVLWRDSLGNFGVSDGFSLSGKDVSNPTFDYFNIDDGNFYSGADALLTNGRSYIANFLATGGQAYNVEQINFTDMFKDIVAEKITADNIDSDKAITLSCSWDGTTTPPTILSSSKTDGIDDVSDVIRTSTGVFEIIPSVNFENTTYRVSQSAWGVVSSLAYTIMPISKLTTKLIVNTIKTNSAQNALHNLEFNDITITGGRN